MPTVAHTSHYRFPAAMIGLALCFCSAFITAQERLPSENFNLNDYKGQVVYLDFWASWCGPCRATFPFMNELQAAHGDALKVIAVNLDQQRSDADRFLKKYPASFDIVFDPSGVLANKYQPPGMPTSFLFDRTGNLAGKHVGFRKKDASSIRESVEQLLKQENNGIK